MHVQTDVLCIFKATFAWRKTRQASITLDTRVTAVPLKPRGRDPVGSGWMSVCLGVLPEELGLQFPLRGTREAGGREGLRGPEPEGMRVGRAVEQGRWTCGRVWIYVGSKLAGCGQLAGRFEERHQTYALHPERGPGRVHGETPRRQTHGVPAPLIRVGDITPRKHAAELPGFQAWLEPSASFILV